MTSQRRLPRADRRAQLVGVARAIVVEEGADALTLGRLAARAGVSKPVVYDHFGTRAGALIALYEDLDRRQSHSLHEALARSAPTVAGRLETIARCHVECFLDHGAELAGVTAALSGSPDLVQVVRRAEEAYVRICREAITSCDPETTLDDAAAVAFLGAADALGEAAVAGSVDVSSASTTLLAVLLTLVDSAAGGT